jgi:hypothetical protein
MHLTFYEDSQKLSWLTTATDGHIAVWPSFDPNSFKEETNSAQDHVESPLALKKVHQSSIKACIAYPYDSTRINTKRFMVITGGDDNALSFSSIDLVKNRVKNNGEDVEEITPTIQSFVLRNAHSAAVVAVEMLAIEEILLPQNGKELGKAFRLRILSLGADQLIKTWEITKLENAPMNELLVLNTGDQPTSIADPACFVTYQVSSDPSRSGSEKVRARGVAVGIGIEILDLGEQNGSLVLKSE